METTGGVVSGPVIAGGRTSQILRLKRSPVGAVSLIVTTVPAEDVGEFCRCTQNVSPDGERNWCTIVWLVPTVRAVCVVVIVTNT